MTFPDTTKSIVQAQQLDSDTQDEHSLRIARPRDTGDVDISRGQTSARPVQANAAKAKPWAHFVAGGHVSRLIDGDYADVK